jgi:site-specific DNA-methyltransferase (adenine-specific)
MKKTQIVISGDNVETLKNYPDNYFDSVVTDCPYGLGKEPNAQEMLKAWVDTGYLEVKGSGFMGKEWDAFVPQPLFWKEIYRVLKHGGHIVAFFGTRTYDWGCMAIRLGGFEIRDCIQWVYGSGFPKSHNVSKAIDKMKGAEREIIGKNTNGKGTDSGSGRYNMNNGKSTMQKEFDITTPSTEQAKQWEGWGSALKPANEPIVLARKPLEKGLSIAENVLKWGTGAINIDVSRISVSENDKNHRENASQGNLGENSMFGVGGHNGNLQQNGRFPSNFIMTHHEDCECKGTKKVKSDGHHSYKISDDGGLLKLGLKQKEDEGNKYAENGQEEVENWDCHEDCPVKILDKQSGVLKSGNLKSDSYSADKGGASRFFYVAKASQWERNYGLDGFEEKKIFGDKGETFVGLSDSKKTSKNSHPTIKPIKLMQYLVRLVTPTNGIVLDPFAGSGTTGIACKIDGYEFVGLELSEEFTKISNQRIESFNEENLLLDDTTIYKNRNKTQKLDTNTKSKEQLNLF